MIDFPKENDRAASSGHCAVELLICGLDMLAAQTPNPYFVVGLCSLSVTPLLT
jgi:hypothetical protein